jgi:hypothetical protein
VIAQHVDGELRGRLLSIAPEYQARMQGDAS